MLRVAIPTLLILFSATRVAGAAEIYNEGTAGDLSNDRLNPTQLTVAPGSNTLTATSVAGDREYFRFTVPAGKRLSAIVNTASNGVRSFVAVQNGSTFTEPPTGTVAANLLGYTHFGTGDATVGTDILDNMALSNARFSGALPAGDYVFWSQETGAAPTTYTLDFQITTAPPLASPLPPVMSGLLALALCGLGFLELERRSKRGVLTR